VFAYTASRARDGPQQFLKRYRGYLQADAFGGYDGIYATGNVVEVACWAHARRKFYEARTSDAERSHAALAWIGRLYEIEKRAKELSVTARQALRQMESVPILTALCQWLREQGTAVLPKSPFGQAVTYALNNWKALVRYTEAGILAIDNNAAEREMKRIAIGRKNWLFTGSDRGGAKGAVLFSITSSCQNRSVEDIHEVLVGAVPGIKFGLAFCEASGSLDLIPSRDLFRLARDSLHLLGDPRLLLGGHPSLAR